MRIIAGEKRGVRLLPPGKRDRTRPTEDRIKESVFNIIQPVRKGASILDLFAGTGQIGIEFLSRGAGNAVFCEKSRSMAKILRENLDKTGYQERSVVFVGDYREALGKCSDGFDYVFLDPPYGFEMEFEAMEMLRRLHRVKPGGMVILESGLKNRNVPPLPETIAGFVQTFERDYRTKRISVYQEAL